MIAALGAVVHSNVPTPVTEVRPTHSGKVAPTPVNDRRAGWRGSTFLRNERTATHIELRMRYSAILLFVISAGCARASAVPLANVNRADPPADPPLAHAGVEVPDDPLTPFPGPCSSTFQNHQMTVRTDFDYDESGRVTRISTDGAGRMRVRSFRYDERGRLVQGRTETTAPNAYVQIETSHYDTDGRVERVDIDDGSGVRWRTVYTYDAAGRMRSREQQNVARNRTTFSRRFVYEGARLVRDEVDNAGDGTYPHGHEEPTG